MRLTFLLYMVAMGCRSGVVKIDDTDSGTQDTGGGETGGTDDSGAPEILGEEVVPTLTIEGVSATLFGRALAEGDVDGDGADDLLVGAPRVERDDTATVSGSGTVYLFPGPVRADTDFLATYVTFHGFTDADGVGTSVAYGDVNNDGVIDVVIGGGMPSSGAPSASGFVVVARGPFAGDVSLSRETFLASGGAADAFGFALAVGDVTHDGIDDVVAGAPYADDADAGEMVVYAGVADGTAPLFAGVVGGDVTAAHLGEAVATGDVDGDGARDLLVGAPGADGDATASGAAYVFTGSIDGVAYVEHAETTYGGAAQDDLFGASVALADVDNDGYDDALIGAPGNDEGGLSAGLATVLYAGGDTARLTGDQPGAEAGRSVAFVNDVNGDGVFDIAVGAPRYDEAEYADAGRGYIVLGPVTGRHSLRVSGYVAGSTDNMRLGLASLGDTEITGDSVADYLFGAPNVNDATASMSGVVHLVAGD